MLVEEVMDHHPPQCYVGQSLVTAARTIHERGAAGALVFDLRFRLFGVLALDDLVRWEARRSDSRGWRRMLNEPSLVAHAMTHDSGGVSRNESISDAARIMRYGTRSVLPVLNNDGSPAGMISASGIAAAVARTDMSIRDEVYEVAVRTDGTTEPGSIDVHVATGTVTLTGVVESRKKLTQLQRAVASITGVSCIDARDVVCEHVLRSST